MSLTKKNIFLASSFAKFPRPRKLTNMMTPRMCMIGFGIDLEVAVMFCRPEVSNDTHRQRKQNKHAKGFRTSSRSINITAKRASSAFAVQGSCRAFRSFTTASPYFRRAASIRWLTVAKGADVTHAKDNIAEVQGEAERALAYKDGMASWSTSCPSMLPSASIQ